MCMDTYMRGSWLQAQSSMLCISATTVMPGGVWWCFERLTECLCSVVVASTVGVLSVCDALDEEVEDGKAERSQVDLERGVEHHTTLQLVCNIDGEDQTKTHDQTAQLPAKGPGNKIHRFSCVTFIRFSQQCIYHVAVCDE